MTRRPTLTPFALVLGLGLAFVLGDAEASTSAASISFAAADAADATPAGTMGRGVEAACPDACDSCGDGVCKIACEVGSACEEQTVACPPGMDCEVACTGDGACESSTIVGAPGQALAVRCEGASSCGDVVLDSGRDLELTCKGSAACQSATLHCSSGACDWACAAPGSCDGMAVE